MYWARAVACKDNHMQHQASIHDAAGEGTGSDYHVPVLYQQCMEALQVQLNGIYVDCTFGGGGHSRGILQRLGPQGRLIAFDQDADAASNLVADERITFVAQNFRHLQRYLRLYEVPCVTGLLADLGVSSHQFDEASRGFSYRYDAALDMRMDNRQPLTAATLLNTYDAGRLQKLLSEYGEVTNARTLAQAIVERRNGVPFANISDLLQVLQARCKGNPQRYYAQVFQALRIEVNDELGALREMLQQLDKVICKGGRVAIITFHSVEDRVVKQHFSKDGAVVTHDPVYGDKREILFKPVHKKPIEAGNDEIKRNGRARSAKLRVYERV